MVGIGNFLALTLTSLVPIVATAIGGMFAERARATNIALDGCMLIAALAALAAGARTGSPWLGLVAGVGAGAALSCVLAFAAFALRCDLIIAGIATNLLATGVGLLIVQTGLGQTGTYAPIGVDLIPRIPLGPLADVPILGPALHRQSALTYVTVALVVAGAITLNRTRFGVHVKAVGQSEEAALAVGIRPVLVRTAAVVLSGAAAGVGGTYLSLSSVASWSSRMTAGLGFIAFSAVIFGRATPSGTVVASLLFAVATAAAIQLQTTDFIAQQLVQTLPYLATVAALAAQSINARRANRFDVSDTTYLPAIIPRG